MLHFSIVVICANSVLVELIFILRSASINVGQMHISLTNRGFLYSIAGF